MDEHKLAELFREAADNPPPASFDVAGVRTASARATARRRTAWASGSALAVVLVFGGVVLTTVPLRESGTAGSAMEAPSPNLSQSEMSAGIAEPGGVPDKTGGMPPKSIPEDSSTQGDEPMGTADPRVGEASSACAEVDRELAVALADELPVANFQPTPATATCPEGARGASFLVRENGVWGLVSAVLVPAGETVLGSTAESRPTKKGATVYVLTEPAAGEATGPFVSRLGAIAEALAEKF